MAFTFVGGYVLFQRPGHPEGRLFMATGVVEAVMFFGRQIGHSPTSEASSWWGWLGVWPLVGALALTTFSVICFPDGRLPSPRWRSAGRVLVAVTVVCAALSAGWPVEYEAAGVVTPHPLTEHVQAAVELVWSTLAHPAYIGMQVFWVVAVAARWRSSGGHVRRQLAWLLLAAAVSIAALAAGLIGWRTPTPGVLAAALMPVAAGLAIVHGQQAAAYAALSWLSRTGRGPADLPTDLAQAVAQALTAPAATLWLGNDPLHAVGVWPETYEEIPPATFADLRAAPGRQVREVTSHGAVAGAVSVDRADRLSRAEDRLLADLVAQAALVIDHLNLADLIARQRRAGHLDGLSPRECEVLELMSRGLTNAAICAELHLSVKTVEPVVSTIFTKLGLHSDAGSNRRVLAVLAYLRA